MIRNYKKRVMAFIDRVAKEPVEKGDQYSHRLTQQEKSFYKTRILGNEGVKLTHRLENNRVQVIIILRRNNLFSIRNNIQGIWNSTQCQIQCLTQETL